MVTPRYNTLLSCELEDVLHRNRVVCPFKQAGIPFSVKAGSMLIVLLLTFKLTTVACQFTVSRITTNKLKNKRRENGFSFYFFSTLKRPHIGVLWNVLGVVS